MAGLWTRVLEFVTYDVFTQSAFAGNPLAMVMGADELSSTQMQVIAKEFNLSETIFVQRPVNSANTARVRIFFPTGEIPFAGHPTIGCAIHLALQDRGPGDFEAVIRLEEQAGLVSVAVTRQYGVTLAELTAPVVPRAAVDGTVPELAALADALSLSLPDIGFDSHVPGLWEGGPRFLYVPVSGLSALKKARPREPVWSQVITTACVDCIYLYTTGQGCDFRARVFAPTAGIPEDPATGSASAILAAQLLASGVPPNGESRFSLQQGAEMGRPSQIGLRCVVSAGNLQSAHISGSAVEISRGRINAPRP